MTRHGTELYEDWSRRFPVPDLVRRAVAAAEELDFDLCVHPATGRLLQCLAGGVPDDGLVGETGTGTGAGLAWMVSAGVPCAFVSVERDAERAAAARAVFADHPNVTILTGDAGDVFARGPFDLLVHDGGWGSAKTDSRRVDPTEVLRANGVMTIDDYTPMTTWPPTFLGAVDTGRDGWLRDERLLATEITVAPGMAVLVCRRTPAA
jgi:predicted O-methyltransferase YrrM